MPVTIKEAQLKYKDPNTGDYVPVAAIADYSDIDVRVNGTSVMNDGIANIPAATISQPGVLKASGSGSGLQLDSNGYLKLNHASSSQMKTGTSYYAPITAGDQHESVFYGLAKAAGDSTQSSSNNPVGTYTPEAQSAIKNMIDVKVEDVQIGGVSCVNNGVANLLPASSSTVGVVYTDGWFGTGAMSGKLYINTANDNDVKSATQNYKPVSPSRQHMAAFYGLAKAAGADMASLSSTTVGQYPDAQKIAIQKMLGVYQSPWELIVDYTTTENLDTINVETDLNGEPFECKEIYVRAIIPASTTGNADYFTAQVHTRKIDASSAICTCPTLSFSATASKYAEYKLTLISGIISTIAKAGSSWANTQNAQMSSSADIDYASFRGFKLKQYSSTTSLIPSGTNIKIYGRRKWD